MKWTPNVKNKEVESVVLFILFKKLLIICFIKILFGNKMNLQRIKKGYKWAFN